MPKTIDPTWTLGMCKTSSRKIGRSFSWWVERQYSPPSRKSPLFLPSLLRKTREFWFNSKYYERSNNSSSPSTGCWLTRSTTKCPSQQSFLIWNRIKIDWSLGECSKAVLAIWTSSLNRSSEETSIYMVPSSNNQSGLLLIILLNDRNKKSFNNKGLTVLDQYFD
jgi:hypothetical protein